MQVFQDFLAAIISVPVWVYLGYFGASNFDQLKTWIQQGQMTILIILFVVIVGFLAKKCFSRKFA